MRFMVINSTEEFDRFFKETTDVVHFKNKESESLYAEADATLAASIDHVCASLPEGTDSTVWHQNYDWWPNKTRYLYLVASAVSIEIVERLAALLSDQFEDWRIQVMVHNTLSSVEIGAMIIYHSQVAVERSVLHLFPSAT